MKNIDQTCCCMDTPSHLTNIFPYWTHHCQKKSFLSDGTKIEPTLTDARDAKMQVNIHYLMNIAVSNQSDLNLAGICLDNTLQTSCKSLNTL